MRQDLSGCITMEGLSRLFDDAFDTWQSESARPDGCRRTPRIPVRGAKPLFVVSYTYDGREVDLNRPATLVDISADGLGIALDQALPVGAAVRFAFGNQAGQQNHGIAFVAHVTGRANDYCVGLTFGEDARSIDVASPALEIKRHYQATREWPGRLEHFRRMASFARRVVTQRHFARKELNKNIDGKKILFVVEAKLFRYSATLFVEGRKVVSQSGALNDRLRGLFCDATLPTVIHLQGCGFSGWATLRANTVMACSLDLSLQRKQQICSQALQTVSELAELLSPVGRDQGTSTPESSVGSRRASASESARG